MNWSTEISNMLPSLTKTLKLGYCPLFSIFIIVWNVRPHKLRKVFLRPASFLAGVFYRQPEAMKIKSIFIMFHTTWILGNVTR